MKTTGMRAIILISALLCAAVFAFGQAAQKVAIYDGKGAWDTLAQATDILKAVEGAAAGTACQGQPVLRNGRVTIACTPHGIDLYSVDTQGKETFRGTVVPVNGVKASAAFRSAEIQEAGKNSAVIAAIFSGDGGDQRLRVSLKRDEVTCEFSSLTGATGLRIIVQAKHVMLPAFVGDDYIFNAKEQPAGRSFLPSENSLLYFQGNGDAMMQLVWPVGDQQVEVVVADGEPRALEATDITFSQKSVFVAAWECPGLWADGMVIDVFTAKKVQKTQLAWSAPFDAQWRAVFHGKGQDTTWVGRDHDSHGVIGQHGGRSIFYTWPLWIAGGKTMLALPPAGLQEKPADYFVVYALRRAAKTPVNMRTPEDVLRESLGAGPCEYLLNLEGIGELEAPGGPLCILNGRYKYLEIINNGSPRTSDFMMLETDWVLQQGIQEYTRVKQYTDFGKEIAALCAAARKEEPALDKPLAQIESQSRDIVTLCNKIIDGFARTTAGYVDFKPKSSDPITALHEIHAEWRRALKQRTPESLAECSDLAHKIYTLAGAPQGGLPDPRRLTQLIQNEALKLAPLSPKGAQLSKKIRERASETLRSIHWSETGNPGE